MDFDGVFRDSQVWVNGFYLGRESSGYSPFSYDISDYLNYGGTNVIAVRVDATLEEGWFYEGAGIYRHVWLTKTAPLHVARFGTFVTTEVKKRSADVTARVTVNNDQPTNAAFEIKQVILDADGKTVASGTLKKLSLAPGESREFSSVLDVSHPKLWSCETPYLHKLVTTINQGDTIVDRYETTFGIRTLRWDANEGFFLNGRRVQLKGTCDHQDHAGVGVALPDGVNEFRVEQLKKMGSNAIRTSHNPPTPELLDACDRLGMLVMDENREYGINPQQLDGLKQLILRDRNHPCVIIWSLGNEEWTVEGSDKGTRITQTMQTFAQRLDPTRRFTVAISGGWGGGSSRSIDVMGFNYFTHGSTDKYHKQFPNKPSVATEDGSTFSTRGIYVEDREHQHLTAYDTNKPDWGLLAEESWPYYAARPYIAGQFQWTGFDYRGEPTPFGWPAISTQFGILDTCGFPKDNFYYYQAWWSDHPVLHIFPHWNWPGKEGQDIDVWAFSNCEEVELFLNGVSQGRKKMPKNSHLEWKVKYAPGVLLARGYNGGKEILTEKIETTGKPAAIQLTQYFLTRPGLRGQAKRDPAFRPMPKRRRRCALPAQSKAQGRRRRCRHHHRFRRGRARPPGAGCGEQNSFRTGRAGQNPRRRQRRSVVARAGRVSVHGHQRARLAAQPVQRPRADHRAIHEGAGRNQAHRARRRSDAGDADHSLATRHAASGGCRQINPNSEAAGPRSGDAPSPQGGCDALVAFFQTSPCPNRRRGRRLHLAATRRRSYDRRAALGFGVHLLSLANQGDTTLTRAERGVHAASPSKTQAGRTFYAARVVGHRSGLKPALRHLIVRISISTCRRYF